TLSQKNSIHKCTSGHIFSRRSVLLHAGASVGLGNGCLPSGSLKVSHQRRNSLVGLSFISVSTVKV
ncbi:hypothetical protein ACQP3D_27820, partial [Escherichia coli]